MRSKWNGMIKATGLLSLCALVIFFAARVVGAPSYHFLYGNNFAFVPGHWVRFNLNRLTSPTETCVLVGTSVVREGFDNELLSSIYGTKFVNVATTGGMAPIDALDIQSAILEDFGQQLPCIIVGLNSFYINRLNEKSYELLTTDYLSQLPLQQSVSYVRFWPAGAADVGMISRLMLPLGEHVVVLQRWWRYFSYLTRQGLRSGKVELRSHELRERELRPASQYMYEKTEPSHAEAIEGTRDRLSEYDMENPAVYRTAEPTIALRSTLDRLNRLTDRLYLVEMPLTSTYAKAEDSSAEAFEDALSAAAYDMRIRCEVPEPLQEALFFDTAHLNQVGRQRLSRSVASLLHNGKARGLQKQDLCVMVSGAADLEPAK